MGLGGFLYIQVSQFDNLRTVNEFLYFIPILASITLTT